MKLRIVIILLILLLGAAAAWYFYFRKEEKQVVLQTEMPQYGYIARSVTATGTVQPVDTVAVGSQVSGTIKNIYTDFNAKVRKGQLLAELDKSLFVAAVDQYKANLDVAKAALVYQKSNFDRTHLNELGKKTFGRIVADTLIKTQVELGPDVIGEPAKPFPVSQITPSPTK